MLIIAYYPIINDCFPYYIAYESYDFIYCGAFIDIICIG